jgi:hypothetical protein
MSRHLIALAIAILPISVHADDRIWRSCFCYPDSQISIHIGTGTSKAIPYKNHFIPKHQSEHPFFTGGYGTEGQRSDNATVQWKFIQKTEYGDLYIFAITKGANPTIAIPALFTGTSTALVYDKDKITVQIDPLK